jgi:hypothetical protein
MDHSISFQHGVSIRFTEPHSSDQLLTIQLGGQEATLSLEETDKLSLWLHQHRQGDTGPSEQAVNGFFAGMAALAEDSDEVFTRRRILACAEQYARSHWEVSETTAHLSLTEDGTPEPGDGENSYPVCLDMPEVGDIQRIAVVVNEHGTLERDHTYTDDAGCLACAYGKVREHLPAASEESE